MKMPALNTQEQYDELPAIAVAARVGEWKQVFDQAQIEPTPPELYVRILQSLTDVCIAWARRRGLADNRPAAAVADARTYCTEHPAELAAYDQAFAGVQDFVRKVSGP